ncbi:UNVERIFIED_CONTAM: hypothetical protein Slati_1521200 [Sesamum latifolium]|uniref:Transposase n=1 Tax=Sesamum latifolium TaxID=2727402 RepID=A0AAW2X785_9LAMI
MPLEREVGLQVEPPTENDAPLGSLSSSLRNGVIRRQSSNLPNEPILPRHNNPPHTQENEVQDANADASPSYNRVGLSRNVISNQVSASRGRSQRRHPNPPHEHIPPLTVDNDPPLEWEEEMKDDPFNGDPPSRNSVGHSFPPRRRGLSRGTSQPIDPSLRVFIRVIGSRASVLQLLCDLSLYLNFTPITWQVYCTCHEIGFSLTEPDRRLRDMLGKERKYAALKVKSSKPLDWKGHGPKWLGESIWNKLCEDYWSKEKFLRLSEAGKKNRTTPNDGSISTHTGGSKPFAAYKEDMQREYNREVSDIELYDRTHRENKGTGEFSCYKAKIVRVTYDTMVQGNDASNPSSPHNFDPVAWLEASGGLSKGRVYGFGSQPLHRSFGDIACGSGFKAKHKEAAKIAQEESNEPFDRFQKEMEKLKQTNMQLQGQQRVILKAMEQCLPDTIRQMLQDIQWTNHSHAGGSGNQEQQYVDSINRGEGRRSRVDSNRYNNKNVMSNVGINDAHESEEGDTED